MKKNRSEEFASNPKKALFILALPIIISMLVQTTYNIVDTAFIGRLGTEAIAALTFSFPIFFILVTFSAGIGIGMGSRISRLLGSNEKEKAENAALHGLLLAIAFGIIMAVWGFFFLKDFFVLLGADGNTLNLALDYMNIIIFGMVIMFPSFILNQVFISQGDSKMPMRIQISALLLNIILDPIFIYVLGYGVKGAAIATVIAFAFSLALYIFNFRKHSYLELSLSKFKFSLNEIREILVIGVPSTVMMFLISVYAMFINRFMTHFGVEHVAAFGISMRLEQIAIVPIIAFSIAMVTLSGMLYGSRRYHLLREIIHFGTRIAMGLTLLIGLIFFAAGALLVRIFTSDPHLISLSYSYLRIAVFAYPFYSGSMIISRAMQGMGLGMPGLIINLVRVAAVGVPLAYLFVYVLDYSYLSIPVSAVIAAFISCVIAFWWIEKRLIEIEKK